MAIRGFGQRTLTGSAQPAFGCQLTAATGLPSPDVFTGNLNSGSRASSLVLTVAAADINIFRKADKIYVGPAGVFLLASTLFADVGTVNAINLATNQITVGGLIRPHAAGEFVVLGIHASRILIRANANAIYVGEDSSISLGMSSTCLADYIQPGASYDLGPSVPANVYGTSHYWFLGTAADTYVASIVQV